MKGKTHILWTAVILVAVRAPAQASIIVDHQPHPYGGLGSDTAFNDPFGHPVWQRVADDFTLAAADQVTNIAFLAFYDADNPPPTETLRIRFYDSRPSDTLPGLVIYEETFLNPVRMATGRRIQVGIGPYEYRFQASLASPVAFDAGVKYWLEVVQIGDLTTHFRWEASVTERNGISYINQSVLDWQLYASGGDAAFQLISPEPASLATLALGFLLITLRRRSGREAHEWKSSP